MKVPTVIDEDRRLVHRELLFVRRDRGRHTNRIKGLLAGQGVPLARLPDFPTHLVTARPRNGEALPALLRARLQHEWDTVLQYTLRIRALKKERRALMINTAWAWLRFQPHSALVQWYKTRFSTGSSRVRNIGIVALARKLLIALWRYLGTDAIPEGAVVRT